MCMVFLERLARLFGQIWETVLPMLMTRSFGIWHGTRQGGSASGVLVQDPSEQLSCQYLQRGAWTHQQSNTEPLSVLWRSLAWLRSSLWQLSVWDLSSFTTWCSCFLQCSVPFALIARCRCCMSFVLSQTTEWGKGSLLACWGLERRLRPSCSMLFTSFARHALVELPG